MKFSNIDLSDFDLKKRNSDKKNPKNSKKIFAVLGTAFLTIAILTAVFFLWSASFFKTQNVKPLSEEQTASLNAFLNAKEAIWSMT